MELVNNFLKSTQNEIIVYVICFVLGSVVFFFLAKSRSESSAALQTLEVVKLVLRSKLGNKADGILDVWIEGLKKIQDGEFSQDDAVDHRRMNCPSFFTGNYYSETLGYTSESGFVITEDNGQGVPNVFYYAV